MPRQVTIAINPTWDGTAKIIAWAANNFLRPTDHIRLVTILVLDPELADHDWYIDSAVDEGSMNDMESQLKAKFNDGLEQIKKVLNDAGFDDVEDLLLVSGPTSPCQMLIQDIETNPPVCLIMGSRDLSRWKRFIMGSFVDQVQSKIHCPILIVK
ncbi:adenine nucleotide alpha hydrolases-like protein [Lichtheimia hyalospora FSU 10163]|nr:adenine nucleotide alpha hydrolases-like protein [Lichtheimia hyalospora FSU 10163]